MLLVDKYLEENGPLTVFETLCDPRKKSKMHDKCTATDYGIVFAFFQSRTHKTTLCNKQHPSINLAKLGTVSGIIG